MLWGVAQPLASAPVADREAASGTPHPYVEERSAPLESGAEFAPGLGGGFGRKQTTPLSVTLLPVRARHPGDLAVGIPHGPDRESRRYPRVSARKRAYALRFPTSR